MRFDASQSMKLGQSMKLAPRMIQSMEILQMALAELEERIEQELESNVALERVEGDGSADASGLDGAGAPEGENPDPAESSASEAREDFDRLDDFEHDDPEGAENTLESPIRERLEPGPARGPEEGDAKFEAMNAAPARTESLTEQLLAQWGLVEVDDRTHALGTMLIEKLDEDGFLRVDLARVAADAPAALAPVRVEELERALTAAQVMLEPPGVAARDHRECLLLQIDALEDDPGWDDAEDKAETLRVARILISDHLDDLKNNRLPRIAERAKLDLESIRQALALMKRLSLAPARPIGPDAIVEYDADNDRYVAYLNDRRLANVQVNREYALLSKDKSLEKKDRDFIKTNLANAQWLLEAIEQRRSTLLRVLQVVIEAQRDFFDQGPQALRPLPMTDVAQKIGVHVATVSRAVAEKHIMTPRGVVPLRRFFSGGLSTESGEEMSYDAVRAALLEIIAGEDKSNPLSDEALAEAVQARGIDIARRTIAKYRTQLNIPAARLRKQH
jgi:RNA polymerase sigma-54 factor